MDVKMKMLEAAIVQLRGRALEHIVAIEILLKNPVGVSDHTNFVADLMMHAGCYECTESVLCAQSRRGPRSQGTGARTTPCRATGYHSGPVSNTEEEFGKAADCG